jgi:SAM-dependent methyltransferase
MYEKLEECPSCKGTKFENHHIVTDHSITKESFAIVRCTNCNLLLTNPRPDETHIWKYYDSQVYISHSNKTTSLRDILYKIVRSYTLKKKVALVKRYIKVPTLLDYGAGTGHFLKAALTANINSLGVEPTKDTTLQRESELAPYIYKDLDSLPTENSFDVITAWHVLEHVHNLNYIIKQLKKRLNQNGHMIIALPNHLSYDANHYQEHWAGYDVPRHLYHFNPDSFKNFAKSHKLKLIETLPMKFDAFYVSMLSEQYLSQSNSLLNGLKLGLKSNSSAASTNQYSSMIYILKK